MLVATASNRAASAASDGRVHRAARPSVTTLRRCTGGVHARGDVDRPGRCWVASRDAARGTPRPCDAVRPRTSDASSTATAWCPPVHHPDGPTPGVRVVAGHRELREEAVAKLTAATYGAPFRRWATRCRSTVAAPPTGEVAVRHGGGLRGGLRARSWNGPTAPGTRAGGHRLKAGRVTAAKWRLVLASSRHVAFPGGTE